jgi:exonuclease VII small subunit
MNDKALPDLVKLLREHRDSLEERLAEYAGRLRGENLRAEHLMKRLEEMRDTLIDVMKTARAAHKECRLRTCPSCSGIKRARKTLEAFRWE